MQVDHGGLPRVALCFLTSAVRAPAPQGEGGALWSPAAWQWLVDDFESRSGRVLESAFCLLRHDDSVNSGGETKSMLDRATLVEPAAVPTLRASMALVHAEIRLLKAALAAGCQAALILSGSCLPLVPLDELHHAATSTGRSIVQYHFMKGGQQRLFGVPYGSLQWKVWHRTEAEVLVGLDENALEARWKPLEDVMNKYNVAPDELVLVNELYERIGSLDDRCERKAVTFTEWETSAPRAKKESGPKHGKTYIGGVPPPAWAARERRQVNSVVSVERGVLLCRKVCIHRTEDLSHWQARVSSRICLQPDSGLDASRCSLRCREGCQCAVQ